MSSTRVFLGRVPNRASERDVEKFFRDFKVREVVLKQGYGFVEFDNSRDADDACYEMNGKDLCGERVVVEMSKGRGYSRGGFAGRSGGRGGFGGRGDYGGRGGGRRFAAPVQTRYRLLVENLSTRCSWQDLKDMMRGATFADAHKKAPNEGIVCFATHDDLKEAMRKNDGKDINGRKIKLIDDTRGGSRSHSRSRSPKSRSRSPRSRSPASRSRSPPPKKNRKSSESD